MYLFSLITGSTYMVFTYILPLLSLLILYHQPKLILWTGVAGVLVNLASIGLKIRSGELTLESSKDAEIQMALILLCFGGCYAATVIYDGIHKDNLKFMAELKEKNAQNRQMTMQTIRTIVNTIDAKDEYTKGHSQRVSEYSAALAEGMGMREEDVERIRYIALLHDIGKIGVPDAILNKPGRLNSTEFALMKLHTVVGGEILKDINSLEDLDVGAKYHHERYDGKGYPDGLKGEEIPLVARIIGIADAYDAMTSNRVYRKRLSDEAVQEEIARCAGAQFDPGIAEVFLKLLKEGKLQTVSPDIYNAPDDTIGGKVLMKLLDDAGAYNAGEQRKDRLTGVCARIHGEQILSDYLENGEGCLLVVDMDALRNVNSMHGFLKGDLYLNMVARVLEQSFTEKIIYRSSGDEFVCFLCGVTRKDVVSQRVDKFYENLEHIKSGNEELEGLSVSVGGLIVRKGEYSREDAMGRAEKALYFAKQKGGGSVMMYHNLASDFQPNMSHADLNNLLKAIRKKDGYSEVYAVNYPEFSKMVNYLQQVAEQNEQQMQIIMFTVIAEEEESVTVEQRLQAMHSLEDAVNASLRQVDVTMQFSSSQRIVALMNLSKENVETVTNHIISAFYKSRINRDFSIIYDVADLSAPDDAEEQSTEK
jgi:diguanylate cyclase (GGDEF)-like protein/putative nucleotidyltransferase with HDIG domain